MVAVSSGDSHLVSDAAEVLTAAMAAGEALLTSHDQAGMARISGTSTESAPPWNAAAADSVLTPHAGLRELENEARAELGLDPVTRGGSDANTQAAVSAVVSLSAALPRESQAYYARRMDRWAQIGLSLAAVAVTRLPQWLVIYLPGGGVAPDCPYCATASLRRHNAWGIVACLFIPCPCARHGRRPFAEIDTRGGRFCWRWPDGLVQP